MRHAERGKREAAGGFRENDRGGERKKERECVREKEK